jgi:hypothetical protein
VFYSIQVQKLWKLIFISRKLFFISKDAFSPSKRTQSITVLPADKIGLQLYKATISSKVKEKNTLIM